MPKLADYLASDRNVFINLDEFGTIHNIGGRELSVVVDNDRLTVRTQKDYQGIYVGDILFFVSASAFGKRPKPEMVLLFDDVPYTVFDAQEDNGVYEIILKASE